MKIFLDINVCLDYLVPERQRHNRVKEALDSLKGNEFFLASYAYDTLYYLLKRYLKSENLSRASLDTFFNDFSIKLVSTTGRSITSAKTYDDLEYGILIETAKRISSECIILTYDRDLLESRRLRALTPEDAAKYSPARESIPLLDLKKQYYYLMGDIDDAVLKSIAEARYILGPEVKELEQRIASYIGVKHAVGVSSGTDALVLSLRALAIKLKGQEFWDRSDLIITTPFTFTATGDAILRSGATPLFVDIDPLSYNIAPEKIKEAINEYSSQIVGIIPVHLYGQACEMDEIMGIAREHDLFVVEDVAQAFGAAYKGKKLGSFGDTGCFSFFPSKNLGAFGDAGAVTTNDDELAEILRMLRVHGGRDKYNVEHIGYKARLDTLQAAVLLAKMDSIEKFNESRRNIARYYNENLNGLDGVLLPHSHPEAYHVYHQYTLRILNGKRDEVQQNLKQKGIQTMVYYPVALHRMKVFEKRCVIMNDLNNADEAASSVLSLPIEPLYGENEIRKVVNAIHEFFNRKESEK